MTEERHPDEVLAAATRWRQANNNFWTDASAAAFAEQQLAEARAQGMNQFSEIVQRVLEAFRELGKAWEIDPMGDRYREADNGLDDAIVDLVAAITPKALEPK